MNQQTKIFNASPEGQKAMFHKAGRYAVLTSLNEAIRKMDASEAWDAQFIASLPESQIDGMKETLRETYNRLLTTKGA